MVLPAIAVSPERLTDACTKMFAKQNTAPCMAEGIPVFRTLHAMRGEKVPLRSVSRSSASCLSRCSTSSAESSVERSVAMATPATPMRSTITKNRLSPTFASPDSSSAKKGYRLSPRARRAADDGGICRVEQLLEHAAQRNGQRKQQQLSGKPAVQHIHFCGLPFHSFSPPNAFLQYHTGNDII